MAEVSHVKLPLDECRWTLLMICQHWPGSWFGAVRQQAIAGANVDPELCHHMPSIGFSKFCFPSELIFITLVYIKQLNLMLQHFMVYCCNVKCSSFETNALSWPGSLKQLVSLKTAWGLQIYYELFICKKLYMTSLGSWNSFVQFW